MAAALLLPVLLAGVAPDACDVEVSDVSLLSMPVRLGECGSFSDESSLLKSTCISTPGGSHHADAVCHMMRLGWWRATRSLTPMVLNDRDRVRHFAQHLRNGAAGVSTLVNRGGNAERTLLTPACQWAQNATVVAVAVRFSPKKHGPVSVANVDEPAVHFTSEGFSFDALARGKPLRFSLSVGLEHEIEPELSTWAIGSAGRATLTLVKREEGKPWSNLANPRARPSERRGHVSTWHEMSDHFGWAKGAKAAERQGQRDADEDDEEEDGDGRTKSTTVEDATTTTSERGGSEAQAGASSQTDAESSSNRKNKKRRGRGGASRAGKKQRDGGVLDRVWAKLGEVASWLFELFMLPGRVIVSFFGGKVPRKKH
jgi:hypothetical protein